MSDLEPIETEIKEGSDGHIASLGMTAALHEMLPHWKSQIFQGESPTIILDDLDELELRIANLRRQMIPAPNE